MMRMNSSMFTTAMAKPTSTWPRSRALESSKRVRRTTTSSRKSTKAVSMSRRDICRGRPRSSARALTPKEICSAVNRCSWFSTTSAVASRFSSITTRTPSRELSSRRSLTPSMRFSRTSSAMRSCRVALFTW